MITHSVRHRLEDREELFSPFATKVVQSRGRSKEEEPCPLRTDFQRDRDRIIHSKPFRRLKHKTQVFIAPTGDHYVTRLTHTLEVAQVARTIARALNLNEDLTEAIALGHDIGHTPFGHIGEEEIAKLYPEGFRHAEQSLRIVELLEKNGAGLNLTWEVRHGIASHSKSRGDFFGKTVPEGLSLEGQACRIADAIAYLNHDLVDAFRSGVIYPDDLPSGILDVLGQRHSVRVATMVNDIVQNSWSATGADSSYESHPQLVMGPSVREAVNNLRQFMFDNVYEPEGQGELGTTAKEIILLLHKYYVNNPHEITTPDIGDGRSVIDQVASMTDLYALRQVESINPGLANRFREALN